MSTLISSIRPSKALHRAISTYWSGIFNTTDAPDFSQTVVPNGCIELIIHLSDDHCFLTKQEAAWSKSPVFTLMGLYPQTYEVRFSARVSVFGIRFFPDGIQALFGVPPSEFLATYEDGTDVLGDGFGDLCNRLREIQAPAERAVLADQYFTRLAEQRRSAPDHLNRTVQRIRQVEGRVSIPSLMEEIPLSPRQFQRQFKSRFGMTLRDYLRLTRITAIHRYLSAPQPDNLTSLAYDWDFADQSHFIREFKYHVGTAPGKFLRAPDKYLVNVG